MSSYTEDLLVEQPAIQLMQHELGWEAPGKAEMLKTEMLKRRKAIEPFFAEATKVKAVEEL